MWSQPGIIPALAGNTSSATNPQCSAWDHPRSRGEYNRSPKTIRTHSGSSPLSRGIRYLNSRLDRILRIIPALAGNTQRFWHEYRSGGDHPRSRGEYEYLFHPRIEHPGSSPLSRGIPRIQRRAECCLRIIPALAGNTFLSNLRAPWASDHPRSRGEYPLIWARRGPTAGSSPLSRGILSRFSATSMDCRIIPALAGNTTAS